MPPASDRTQHPTQAQNMNILSPMVYPSPDPPLRSIPKLCHPHHTDVEQPLKKHHLQSDESPSEQTGNNFIDECINSIRFLAIDAVEKAKSGHPGMPMGMAPAAYVLFKRYMNFNPKNPTFINRDRFVLSAGHGSMLLYALMYLFGYDSVALDDIKQFRQYKSKTPGHPENFVTDGIEVTTGPLGQGICNAVGLAMAEAHMAAVYNKPDFALIDNYTYCIMGDGCHMEGMSGEACSLAGHYGLSKLIALYDDNNISIEGSTDLAFTEDVGARFEAYGWQVLKVRNGNTDVAALDDALRQAKACTSKPTLIMVKTVIGYGAPNKRNTAKIHGSALGADEIAATRKYLGWGYEPFDIPPHVLAHYREQVTDGAAQEKQWHALFAKYRLRHPKLAAQFERFVVRGDLPTDLECALREAAFAIDAPMATRQLSQTMLNVIAPMVPSLLGGSADLASSTLTLLKGARDFQRSSPDGRNVRFGVREHAMGAIVNGIALAGYNLIPYCSTFLVFTDYMRGAMRLASLSQARAVFVMTHDSVLLGEDGPTHQPVEHLASFRAMPNHHVIRPADAIETAAAYALALTSTHTPTTLALSRQKVPPLPGTSFDGTKNGMYVISDNADAATDLDVVLLASGSELPLVCDAATALRNNGRKVRVVSAPCVDLFEQQDDEYKQAVLPACVSPSRTVVCEAGASFGWHKYAAAFVCIDQFGISAPGKTDLKEHFGLTVDNICTKAEALMGTTHRTTKTGL